MGFGWFADALASVAAWVPDRRFRDRGALPFDPSWFWRRRRFGAAQHRFETLTAIYVGAHFLLVLRFPALRFPHPCGPVDIRFRVGFGFPISLLSGLRPQCTLNLLSGGHAVKDDGGGGPWHTSSPNLASGQSTPPASLPARRLHPPQEKRDPRPQDSRPIHVDPLQPRV